MHKNIYKQHTAINKLNPQYKKQKQHEKITCSDSLCYLRSANVNAQTVVTGTAVNMADTTSANADALKDAKAFLKRTAGKAAYGADRDITIATGDSVIVAEFTNVKSRSGKTETQWGVTLFNGGKVKAEYIVSAEDPTTALTDKADCLKTAGGCGATGSAKVSVKHGDGPDGALSNLE